jgi:hypothetical protein
MSVITLLTRRPDLSYDCNDFLSRRITVGSLIWRRKEVSIRYFITIPLLLGGILKQHYIHSFIQY